jgi:Protein of unknown function (DUF2569)
MANGIKNETKSPCTEPLSLRPKLRPAVQRWLTWLVSHRAGRYGWHGGLGEVDMTSNDTTLAAAPQAAQPAAKPGPVGVGGWLALPILGLLLTPFRTVIEATRGFTEADGDVSDLQVIGEALLTDPVNFVTTLLANDPTALAGLAGGLFLIFAAFTLGVVAPLVLLVLMFRRSSWLPRGMIAFYIANAVLVAGLAVAMAANWVDNDPTLGRDFAQALMACGIWIPYFNISKRVKNTFVT